MFYDYTVFKMIKTTVENGIGEVVEKWVKGDSFLGDIQPTTGDAKKSMGWGDDVQGSLTLFTDERLNIGDKVEYEGYYEVEKVIKWDYFVYSLKRVDLLG